MEHCHFSYTEARDLPIEYRKWFIARKDKENKARAEAEKRSMPPPPKAPPKRAAPKR